MSEKSKLLTLISIIFLLKGFYIFLFVHEINLLEDHEIAMNLLTTGEMKYLHNSNVNYNYQFPVYPFLLFIVYKICGVSYKCALLLNLLLSSATAYFLFYVLKDFFYRFNLPEKIQKHSELILFSSVAFFLLHPLITYYTVKNVHPFSLNLFFVAAVLFLMLRFFKENTPGNLIIYSVVLGAGLLDRTTLITTMTPFVLLTFINYPVRNSVKTILVVICIVVLMNVPWLIRNYQITHTLSLTSSVGENMWIGTLEETEGTTQMSTGKTYYDILKKDTLLNNISHLPPTEQNSLYMKKYFEILKKDPLHVIKMFFIKLKNFWLFRKNIGVDYSLAIKNYILLYKVYYLITLVLALMALFLLKKKALVYISFPIALSVMQSLVYVETRHRLIIEPFLIFLAVIGLIYSWMFVKEFLFLLHNKKQ
jgi:hypothetical protein